MGKVAAIRFEPGWNPPAWAEGPTRAIRQQVYFETLAGVPRAYVRAPLAGVQHGVFVSGSPAEDQYYPTWHARAGRPRYRWEPSPDGCEHGYPAEDDA